MVILDLQPIWGCNYEFPLPGKQSEMRGGKNLLMSILRIYKFGRGLNVLRLSDTSRFFERSRLHLVKETIYGDVMVLTPWLIDPDCECGRCSRLSTSKQKKWQQRCFTCWFQSTKTRCLIIAVQPSDLTILPFSQMRNMQDAVCKWWYAHQD